MTFDGQTDGARVCLHLVQQRTQMNGCAGRSATLVDTRCLRQGVRLMWQINYLAKVRHPTTVEVLQNPWLRRVAAHLGTMSSPYVGS